jgi:hypothetical protein
MTTLQLIDKLTQALHEAELKIKAQNQGQCLVSVMEAQRDAAVYVCETKRKAQGVDHENDGITYS